jgi:hypothetical protein
MAARKKKKFKRSEFNAEVLGAIVAGAGQPRRKAGTKGGGPSRSTFFENVISGIGSGRPGVSQSLGPSRGRRRTVPLSGTRKRKKR